MDSRIGLDYIVENREYVSKLGAAIDTSNVVVKQQVFELLSALCAYSADGYARAIETLEFYKKHKNERYRLKVVVGELEKAATAEYQVALLAFINCVIISAASLQERIRMRNEFIGLKVLPLLTNLRKAAQGVGDIIVQLDVFDEQRECDEAQSLQGPNGINLNLHLDVFYAILRQVADTPQEVPFLSILQHLLRIDPKEPVSDVIWDTTEKLVHHATLLENHEESERLLRSSLQKKLTCAQCRNDVTSPNRRTSAAAPGGFGGSNAPPPPPQPPAPPPAAAAHTVSITISGTTTTTPTAIAPPPPPPPPMRGGGVQPAPPPVPPPPAPNQLLWHNNNNTAQPTTMMMSRSHTPDGGMPSQQALAMTILLPQQDTPAPKSKMKTINWGKIPANKVIGKQNIWTIVANNHQHSPIADIDWNEMEGLFCLQSTSAQGSPKLGRGDSGGSSSGYDTLDRKAKKESTEITLLDGKRSLNVNIFLKQFRTSNGDIIQLIRHGNHGEIGAEKLRGLLKILPEIDERDMLTSFKGDKARLGNAEKFLLQLMEVPNYKLRIESMLLKEEFGANIGYLEPCINAIIYAGDELINNKMLQDVLYMVVIAGNFLNCGGYAGNAVGVKLASLQKLTDIRANKPGMNLIHFVAMQVEKRNPELLKFTAQLAALENATKTTSEQINNEINTLDTRIRKIKKQIELPTTEEEIKDQMLQFLNSAEREVAVLQAGMKEVDALRLKLADFFCEDPVSFKLEECFKIFQTFCDRFRQAVKENAKRQQLEEQATLRRKQREEQLAKRAKQLSMCGTPGSDSENPHLLLDPNYDPRASPALSRRRMGSFNSGVDINTAFMRNESNDSMSPDITPNGSLRRRRSRVLPEEDDLMEYLRASSGNEHISRDRKAYGSLDRSWARRARSGSSSRRRPDLLNIDFGEDRERANSPAPLVHQQQQPSGERPSPVLPNGVSPIESPTTAVNSITQQPSNGEEAKRRVPREWRQKIETWLQSNEKDEKQNEEYKRRRRLVNSNRRSLENDTDSERKLDTLPEEKTVPSTPVTTTTSTSNFNNNNSTTNYSITSNGCERDHYKRVYPDWKPSQTLEHTDVVGTIQALANVNAARQQYQAVSSPSAHDAVVGHLTTAEELREYRRQRSLEQAEKHTSPLHSIAEEDRRKPYTPTYVRHLSRHEASSAAAAAPAEKLPRIEFKSPTPPTPAPGSGSGSGVASDKAVIIPIAATTTTTTATTSVASPQLNQAQTKCAGGVHGVGNSGGDCAPRRHFDYEEPCSNNTDDTFAQLLSHHKSHNEKYSPKEIDADNIETPPVTRRVFAGSANSTLVSGSNNLLANGNSGTGTGCGGGGDESSLESSNGKADTPPDMLGNFDRYSSTRRTRRYKRPTDYSSGNEEATATATSTTTPSSPAAVRVGSTTTPTNAKETRGENNNKEHKERDQSTSIQPPTTPTRAPLSERTITKLEKVGRHISSINQEDVQEAIRNLKSPTGTPERIWSPPRDMLGHQQAVAATAKGSPTRTPTTTRTTTATTSTSSTPLLKASNHELNDEGFEETQSLVSDTPSHGKDSTASSCNEAGSEQQPPKRKAGAHKMAAGNGAAAQKSQTLTKSQASNSPSKLSERLQMARLRSPLSSTQLQMQQHRTQQQHQHQQQQQQAPASVILSRRHLAAAAAPSSVERSRSLRLSNNNNNNTTTTIGSAGLMATAALQQISNNGFRRGHSMRKSHAGGGETSLTPPTTAAAVRRGDVERSSSRNSLRSSRSSINSAASTNTVRRMPVVVMNGKVPSLHATQPLQTVSVESSPSKRPLTARNNAGTNGGSGGGAIYRNGVASNGVASNGVGPNSNGGGGIPASRSSSSGSSVGQNIVVIRRREPTAAVSTASAGSQHQRNREQVGSGNAVSSLGASTSFKENAVAGGGTRAQSARQAVLLKTSASSAVPVHRNSSRNSSSSTRSSSSVSGFMRPTAASATKRSK